MTKKNGLLSLCYRPPLIKFGDKNSSFYSEMRFEVDMKRQKCMLLLFEISDLDVNNTIVPGIVTIDCHRFVRCNKDTEY